MSQPPGFIDPSFLNHVYKLMKAIYGLKKASRAWYDELRTCLLFQGFTSTISYPSLFTLQASNQPL